MGGALVVRLCVASTGLRRRLRCGTGVFDVPSVSLLRRLDAMPCNEDHDVPHKPDVKVEGMACDPKSPEPPFNLL